MTNGYPKNLLNIVNPKDVIDLHWIELDKIIYPVRKFCSIMKNGDMDL